MSRPIRILLAKPGLDGHDRGIKVIAAALRDSGFEVIYAGLRQTPDMIARAAVEEDVDAVGLSSMNGAHNVLFTRVRSKLDELGATHVVLFGGGIIPESDVGELESRGVAKLFGPGTPIPEIVEFCRSLKPAVRPT